MALPAATLADERCFRREYSAQHLASQPNQTIRALEIRFETQETEFEPLRAAYVTAWFRDREEPFTNQLGCWKPKDTTGYPVDLIGCAVDCDGGAFLSWYSENDTILIETSGFIVQGGCGSEDDLETRTVTDRGVEKTRFKLYWVDAATCRRAE